MISNNYQSCLTALCLGWFKTRLEIARNVFHSWNTWPHWLNQVLRGSSLCLLSPRTRQLTPLAEQIWPTKCRLLCSLSPLDLAILLAQPTNNTPPTLKPPRFLIILPGFRCNFQAQNCGFITALIFAMQTTELKKYFYQVRFQCIRRPIVRMILLGNGGIC